MRAFRPIDHLFLLTLCGLLFVVIALQYYRPSSYLPQQQQKPVIEYKSDPQDLEEVFQLAENWEHTHEEELEITVLPTIPKLPSPQQLEEIISKKEEQVPPTPIPEPSVGPEEKKEQLEENTAESWGYFIINNLPNISFYFQLLFLILGIYLYRLIIKFKRKRTQRDLNAIPLGVKRKQYQIAGDFQSDTIDQDWLEEIHNQERVYLKAHREGNFEGHYEDYLKIVSEDFEGTKVKRPEHSTLEKAIHPIKKWINPNQDLGEPFEYNFKWSDIWAIVSAVAYDYFLFLLTPQDYRILTTYYVLYFFIFFYNLGIFRRSKWAYYLAGISVTVVSAVVYAAIQIYEYVQNHPELLEVDQNALDSFYRNIMIGGGILLAAFVLYRLYRYLRKSKFGSKLKYWTQEPIWLRDASMGNIGLIFIALAFVLSRVTYFFGLSYFFSYLLTSPLIASGVVNIALWLFSPTPKQAADKQWTLHPYQLLIAMGVSAFLSAILYFNGDHYGLMWWLAPVPLFSGLFYFFYFYREDKMALHLEKKEQKKDKKNMMETIKAVEMDAKKLIKKTILKGSKTTPNDRWWDVEEPEKRGMLHLENRMLLNSAKELDKLLKFKNLRFLYLKNNLLEFFPEELIWLKQLRKLDLSDNKIGSIPPQIIVLKHLSVLELANNEIRNLPPWIEKMDQLKVLNLRGNLIPKTQIERLQKKLPQLQIEHD